MGTNGVRTVLTGRGLVESPRWHQDRLYFSDWSAGEVLSVDLDGRSEVVAQVKSLPLCIDWLPDGRLVIVSSADGQLLRREPDGSLVTHADLGQPGWNDIVVDGHGHIYLNRVGFNPVAGEEFRPGFVFLVAADGSVRQVADDIAFPNGMTVTADNSTLIVADSYRHSLVGFDISADGSLSPRRIWTGMGWQAVELDRGGFACMLGGPRRATLFIVAATWQGMGSKEMVAPVSGQVLATDVDVPGAGFP